MKTPYITTKGATAQNMCNSTHTGGIHDAASRLQHKFERERHTLQFILFRHAGIYAINSLGINK